MRKDYIMSDEDKAVKREKIEINRAKKRTGHPSGYEVNYSKAHKVTRGRGGKYIINQNTDQI